MNPQKNNKTDFARVNAILTFAILFGLVAELGVGMIALFLKIPPIESTIRPIFLTGFIIGGIAGYCTPTKIKISESHILSKHPWAYLIFNILLAIVFLSL